MNVSIICGGTVPRYYELLDKHLNDLIEKSGCYLFTILCGRVSGQEQTRKTLGQEWAAANGCPVKYITANTEKDLVRKVLFLSDYIIFILDGNPFINNLFMQYKMMGKHGSVIKV